MIFTKKTITWVLIILTTIVSFPRIIIAQDTKYFSKSSTGVDIRESEIEIRSTEEERIGAKKGEKSNWWLWILAAVVVGGAAAVASGGGDGGGDDDDDDSSGGGSGTVSW